MVTRRQFLGTIGATAAMVRLKPDPTYAADSSMHFGYAAITWGADIVKAMADISAVGFKAIQLRGEAFAQYGDKPKELRALLERHQLTFAVLSSGNLSIDPAREQEMLSLHVKHAEFVRDAGGKYLQVIDERPKDRAVVADDYRRLGRLMTELGKRTAGIGVPLVYHHHMNSTGEKPPEVRAVLDAADRKHVRLLFDVAHYQQGGGDPVAAIREYRDWIDVVHLKDVRPTAAGAAGTAGGAGRSGGSSPYEFVELGRGRVDLQGVFAALRDIKYDKWAIVELDRVPDPGRTAKESAEMNKRYLVDQAHVTI
ncbi:MAG TPA: sugar phosphate isomerase/epimerase [Vicinamibacterales bacterium]|nr:sugar phosphate isomerase/epimerase [Vicinamibacterales bacterium]